MSAISTAIRRLVGAEDDATAGPVQAIWNGVVIASSDRTVVVEGNPHDVEGGVMSIARRAGTAVHWMRALAAATRPVDPQVRDALARRWRELPEAARTSEQLLGRHMPGCEGTHGVFPRCNLACTPCYHAREANRVRTDGAHTVARVAARHPQVIAVAGGWALRFVRRAGVRRLLTGRPRGMTFVVHAFMDADVVAPAWEALKRREVADDPAVRAAQERLQTCSYAMAHPAEGRLVPACVQHAVLDLQENAALARLLSMRPPAS